MILKNNSSSNYLPVNLVLVQSLRFLYKLKGHITNSLSIQNEKNEILYIYACRVLYEVIQAAGDKHDRFRIWQNLTETKDKRIWNFCHRKRFSPILFDFKYPVDCCSISNIQSIVIPQFSTQKVEVPLRKHLLVLNKKQKKKRVCMSIFLAKLDYKHQQLKNNHLIICK